MSSPLPPDPYAILNVPKDASTATIKSVYRKLVLTCHPDKFHDEAVKAQKADQFHQVQQAYEILSDETARARYDERVKLAELRAELMSQTTGRGKMMPDFAPRPFATSTYETRGNAVYEERAPRRSYEDEVTSPRYDDHRSSGRKYDDRYDTQPTRRSSGRTSEDKRRVREYDEEDRRRTARDFAKAAERSSQAERRRMRDKDRRQSYDSKYRGVQIESDSDSESDSTERFDRSKRAPEPRKRHDDSRRREQEDRSRRSKEEDSDNTDEHATKIHYRVASAADYMAKVSGKPVISIVAKDARRPSLARVPTEIRIPPPPPQPPVDFPRRSSNHTSRGKRDSSPRRASGRDRRTPEIVDPSERDYYDDRDATPTRRPALSKSTSERIPSHGGISRAATMETRSDTRHPSAPRRANTSPLSSMVSPPRQDGGAPKLSKLRHHEVHDSGYSSPGTPDLSAGRSPVFTTSKIFSVRPVEEEDEEELDEVSPRHREPSPRSKQRGERPRPGPPRSATYAPEPQTPRHAFVRTHSSRPSPSTPTDGRLFGEMQSASTSYKIQHQSPKFVASDVQYAPYSRRGSGDVVRDRDAYPYRDSGSMRGAHAGLGGRNSSYVKQESVH